MRIQQLFSAFVEKSLERVPLMEIREQQVRDGTVSDVSHMVNSNILTIFDSSLSRHLSALKGEGLPAVTVRSTIAPRADRPVGCRTEMTHHPSLPHALKAVAQAAIAERPGAEFQITELPAAMGSTHLRTIGVDDVNGLERALKVFEWFGQPEFVPVTGDFDMIMLNPLGGYGTVLIDLNKGSVSIPGDSERFEAPIYGFAEHVRDNPALRVLLASLRHAQMEAKRDAILDFRKLAEERILRFDTALRGDTLENYRLDAAMSLVARLRVGLGDDLQGLSEDAQITALGWSTVIEEAARSQRATSGIMLHAVEGRERA